MMPQMPQVRVPRPIVALMLAGLFVVSLMSMRHYGVAGDFQALTLAITAGALCLFTAGGLIYANYETYHARPDARINGRFNGSP